MVTKMKGKSRKHLSVLLALVFGLFAAMPFTVYAASANALKTTIEGFDHGDTGKLLQRYPETPSPARQMSKI